MQACGLKQGTWDHAAEDRAHGMEARQTSPLTAWQLAYDYGTTAG